MNMDWLSVDFHIRLIGVLSFVFIAYSFWFLEPKPKPLELPHKHSNPVLAFSLAKTGDEIDKVKKDHADFVGVQLKKDWGYIAVYLILFLLLSLLLVPTERTDRQMVGMGCSNCSSAGCDFRSCRKHRYVEGACQSDRIHRRHPGDYHSLLVDVEMDSVLSVCIFCRVGPVHSIRFVDFDGSADACRGSDRHHWHHR